MIQLLYVKLDRLDECQTLVRLWLASNFSSRQIADYLDILYGPNYTYDPVWKFDLEDAGAFMQRRLDEAQGEIVYDGPPVGVRRTAELRRRGRID